MGVVHAVCVVGNIFVIDCCCNGCSGNSLSFDKSCITMDVTASMSLDAVTLFVCSAMMLCCPRLSNKTIQIIDLQSAMILIIILYACDEIRLSRIS